jgi:hypothetical protein
LSDLSSWMDEKKLKAPWESVTVTSCHFVSKIPHS